MKIYCIEENTEFNQGHTIYHVRVETGKETYNIMVRREDSRYIVVEPENLNHRLQSYVCNFVKEEYAKMFILGDY